MRDRLMSVLNPPSLALAVLDGNVWTMWLPSIYLPRSTDRLSILDHLLPLRNPAWEPAQCKHDREHVCWDAQRPVDYAGVKIHVGVEVALNEVLVLELAK